MSERAGSVFKVVQTFVAVSLLCIIGFISCDIVSSVQDDPPDPDRDNPRDPESENAQSPIANITSHDTTQSIVLDSHTISIKWHPDTSGVVENVEYQYRFARIGEQIDQKDWRPSEWMSDTSIEFAYLNESFDGGNYIFQVKARSQDDTALVQTQPTQLEFSVNAINDRGIAFHPRTIQENRSGSYSTELWLDEIETTDTLTVVQAEIGFPNNQLVVENIEIFADDRSLLSDSGGNVTDIVTTNQNTGRISINIGVLGGNPEEIEGYGKIGQITFTRTTNNDTSSEISIQPGSQFFNAEGELLGISVGNLDSGIFQVDTSNQN